jgi:predicted metal-binding protein
MADRDVLEALFRDSDCGDFKWIEPKTIVVAQWVRMKCLFGCDDYARNPTCPPNVPPVEACRRFFDEYSTGVVFRFEKRVERPDDRHAWISDVNGKLLALERSVFLLGHVKAFVLYAGRCQFCQECPTALEDCRRPDSARPSPEGLAVDVFSTVRQCGLPIDVLTGYEQPMNRYAFLLVE